MPKLTFRTIIDAPLASVWSYYNSLETLIHLTPPPTGVRIADPPERLYEGARFVLLVQSPPFFAPIAWECFITAYQPPTLFVDEQGKGPFAGWRHLHQFEALPDGRTLLTDSITYLPPLGFLGALADTLFIRPMLQQMFAYRHRITREDLQSGARSDSPVGCAPVTQTLS